MDFDECYSCKFDTLVGSCVKNSAHSDSPRPKLVSRGNLSVHFPLRRRRCPAALILSLFLELDRDFSVAELSSSMQELEMLVRS